MSTFGSDLYYKIFATSLSTSTFPIYSPLRCGHHKWRLPHVKENYKKTSLPCGIIRAYNVYVRIQDLIQTYHEDDDMIHVCVSWLTPTDVMRTTRFGARKKRRRKRFLSRQTPSPRQIYSLLDRNRSDQDFCSKKVWYSP